MEREELRKQCSRFFECKTISDCQDLLDIYSECFFEIVLNHHYESVSDEPARDAKILIQMMMTKSLHLKNLINGVEFVSKNGRELNNIIDPTIVASLVRNIYETTGMFNLIFRNTKSKDEKELIYLLWVTAGLSYRQRFDDVITKQENFEKSKNEKIQMKNILDQIENNSKFLKLDEKNRGKIKTKIKERDYLIKFEEDQVIFLSWRELTKTMQIKGGMLNHIYTYFSLYSHPSSISVFQYAHMFKRDKESYPDLVIFNLKICFYMFSIFIADYINLFPDAKKTFEEMGVVNQIVINFYNSISRGHEYDINDSWKLNG